MAWIKRGYELAFLMFGRPVRPFHLAVTISSGTLCLVNLFDTGLVLHGWTGYLVGLIAGLACVMLIYAWWNGSERGAEWGLLLAAGAWASRAMFGLLNDVPNGWATFMLSLAWTVGASGAYLLERYDHREGISE